MLVIGDHPAASLCALLLRLAKIPVALIDPGTTIGGERFVTLNPAFFDLHKSLAELRGSLDLTPITHARFLAEDGSVASSTRAPPRKAGGRAGKERGGTLIYVTPLPALRDAMRALAQDAGVPTGSGTVCVGDVDESGVTMTLGRRTLRPQLVAVADPLSPESAGPLRLPPFLGRQHAVQTTATVTSAGRTPLGPATDAQGLSMCLDLAGTLAWGWLLPHGGQLQLSVQHDADADGPALLDRWARLLVAHGHLSADASPDGRTIRAYPMPLAGALSRDVVARRSVVFGPAGGFYSASGEDVYPACWSAKFAADALGKAVKAEHPQDALGAYRSRWGSTLGEYLRGPQQNLRFLLPLVFKNPPMTDRLAEAILLGKSLVK